MYTTATKEEYNKERKRFHLNLVEGDVFYTY